MKECNEGMEGTINLRIDRWKEGGPLSGINRFHIYIGFLLWLWTHLELHLTPYTLHLTPNT